jgi:MFS family permease
MLEAGGGPALFTRAFVALMAADLLYFTATGVLLAVTPLYVRDELGGGDAAVGTVMGAFSVTTLLLRPWAGRWADRRGRRRLLVAGAAAFAVLALGHLLAEDLAVLVLLRLLLGAAEALFFVAGFAALADLAPPGRAGEALSINSLSLYVGIAVGPLLGEATVRTSGFVAAWLLTSLLCALAAVTAAVWVPETVAPGGGGGSLVHRAALVPGLALLVGVGAATGFLAFAVLRAREVGLASWGLVPLAFGATVIGLRVLLAGLPDRVDPVRVVAGALGVTAAGLLVLGVTGGAAGLVVGAVLLGVGTALLTPAVFAHVFSVVPAAERGSASATTSIFIDLGLSGGPIALGLLAAALGGVPAGFVAVALLPLAGFAVALVLLRGRASRPPTAAS